MAAQRASKPIRNLTPVQVNLRFGSRKDPYYITLRPRGQSGDVHVVPFDLTEHQAFVGNVNRLFEVITKAEAAGIEYPVADRPSHPIYDGVKTTLVRQKDLETVVGTFKLNDRGVMVEQRRGAPVEDVSLPRARVPGSQENPGPNGPSEFPPFTGIERVKS